MTDVNLSDISSLVQALGINLGQLPDIQKKVKDWFDKLTDSAKTFATQEYDQATKSLKDFGEGIHDILPDAQALRDRNVEITGSFDKVADALSKLATMTTNFHGFDNLAQQSGLMVNTMDSQFNQLLSRFNGNWEKLSGMLLGAGASQLAGMTEARVKQFLTQAASAQKLETAYIGLQAATGNLHSIFDENNKLVPNLTNNVAAFGSTITQTAAMTGQTTESVAYLAQSLGMSTNAMSQFINLGPDKQFQALNAMMATAAGSGLNMDSALKAMTSAYEDLGNAQGKVNDSAAKGIQMIALMSEASNKLGLRLQDTQGYLEEVAKTFKFTGDNTQAAVNLMARFSGALQNTGLTAKASVDVISHMSSAISNLSIGTKALISARTGGPGGLQGAFQLDNLVRQGKMDQVAQKLEQTLKQQFGGRIYSLDDATKSQGAAAQFMRQRSLLTSGAFGNLAANPEQATRLLEALKQGPAATTAVLKNGLDASKDVVERGQEIEKTQVSILSQINSAMDRSVSLQELNVLNSARQFIGKDNAGVNEMFTKSYQAALQNIYEAHTNGPGGLKEQINRQNELGGADLSDSAKALGPGIKNIYNQSKDYMNDLLTSLSGAMKDKIDKTKQTQQLNSDIARSQAAEQRGSLRGAAADVVKNTTKHQIEMKPMAININVSSAPGTNVDVSTDNPNATVNSTVNKAASSGYTNLIKGN